MSNSHSVPLRPRGGRALRKTLPPTIPHHIPLDSLTPPPASPPPPQTIARPRTSRVQSTASRRAGNAIDVETRSPATPTLASCQERTGAERVVSSRAAKRKKPDVVEWEKRFPRRAGIARRGAEEDVNYKLRMDVVQGIPPARCAMRMEERFATRVYETVIGGRAVAGLVGVDVEEGGLEILDEEEESMYRFWEGGNRVPPVGDWKELRGNRVGEGGGGGGVWEVRAADLREIYGVEENVVNAGVAREWWDKFDGWRALVTAMGKMRKWREVVEEEECVRAYEHMRVHREWVRECVKRYEQNVGRGMEVLEKRIVGVRRKRREREEVEELEEEDQEQEEIGRSWGVRSVEVGESMGGSDGDGQRMGNGIVFTNTEIDMA